MKVIRWFWLPLLPIALLVLGCHSGHNTTTSEDKLYDIKGKVVALDVEKKTVKLDHEDITGLMSAMTMEFAVEDAKMLEGLKPGDRVQGRLKVSGKKYLITELKKE